MIILVQTRACELNICSFNQSLGQVLFFFFLGPRENHSSSFAEKWNLCWTQELEKLYETIDILTMEKLVLIQIYIYIYILMNKKWVGRATEIDVFHLGMIIMIPYLLSSDLRKQIIHLSHNCATNPNINTYCIIKQLIYGFMV